MLKIIPNRPAEQQQFLRSLQQRNEETAGDVVAAVSEILSQVRKEGDAAVKRYTLRFDGGLPERLLVTKEELEAAVAQTDPNLLRVLRRAKAQIEAYHLHQKQNSYLIAEQPGILMGQRIRPLKRVGLYVPGGTASYPSSVLMNVIPAKVAGVSELVMATPPGKDGAISPVILAAASIAGVDKIYKMGGAQAIAALAYGTETVPKVDKIVGPGNLYVATAKRLVFGAVDIDMIAGPSEVLIIADETANPKFLAADLMSQAEHDVLASATLICTEEALANAVNKELCRQVEGLSRKEIIRKSMERFGAVLLCGNIEEAIVLANQIAPEHLELAVKDPMSYLGAIDNAGSVFLGDYTPEPLGDYMAGPNHVLPTGGTARFFSPLSVDTFLKKSSYLSFDRKAFLDLSDDVVTLARAEGLTAHANSVLVRKEEIAK